MSKHPEVNNQDSTIADQLDALFAESKELQVEWQKLYLLPSGKPRKRFTDEQNLKLDANYLRSKEVADQILTLMKEAKK